MVESVNFISLKKLNKKNASKNEEIVKLPYNIPAGFPLFKASI